MTRRLFKGTRGRPRGGHAAAAIALTILLSFCAPLQAATLLVVNKIDNTVDLIDVASREIRVTLATGHAPREVLVSADGRMGVVSDYGDREHPGNSLTVLDVTAGRVLRTIDLGEHRYPHGMAWGAGGKLVVTTEGSAHLLVVDVEKGKVDVGAETAQRASHMVAVTADGTRAFVTNGGSASVSAIDLRTATKLSDIRTGEGAEGIVVIPDGREVWVANPGSDTLSVIDVSTLKVISTIPCAGSPIRVVTTRKGARVLVLLARTGEIALFDTRDRKELRRRKLDLERLPEASRRRFADRFGAGGVPGGLLVDPRGRRAWVALTQADLVLGIDPSTLDVEEVIEVGREPSGLGYSRFGVRAPRAIVPE